MIVCAHDRQQDLRSPHGFALFLKRDPDRDFREPFFHKGGGHGLSLNEYPDFGPDTVCRADRKHCRQKYRGEKFH